MHMDRPNVQALINAIKTDKERDEWPPDDDEHEKRRLEWI